MKHLIILSISLFLVGGLHAQNNITFFKNSQANLDAFYDFYIENGGEEYKIIGRKSFYNGPDYSLFFYCKYDSTGTLVDNYQLEFYPYSLFEVNGYAKFLEDGNFMLFYGLRSPGYIQHFTSFMYKNGKAVWHDKGFIRKQIDDTVFIASYYNLDGTIQSLRKIGFYGYIIWDKPTDSFFNLTETLPAFYVEDTLVVLMEKRKNYNGNNLVFYKSEVDFNGRLISQDSFVFGKTTTVDILKLPNGYFAKENDWDSNATTLYILDKNAKILWEKELYRSSISPIFNIDKEHNFHIFIELPEKRTDSTSVFKFFKVSKNGKLLKERYFQVDDNILIYKFKVLDNGGYFIIGNKYIPGRIQTGGCFLMKTDSNLDFVTTSVMRMPIEYKTVKIFPNPLTTTTTFTLPTLPAQKAEFRLYNITGRLVKQESFTSSSFQLKRGNLPSGMYLYSITGNALRFVGKLMIK